MKIDMINESGIIILDFGSQYTQLIARRIRENNVYSEILSPETKIDEILSKKPAALILSGGPNSVYKSDAPKFDTKILSLDIPIMGICYGLQLLAHKDGGRISSSGDGEYGFATINIDKQSGLFSNISSESEVWMSHGDKGASLPEGFVCTASSANSPFAAIEDSARRFFGVQFHPEVTHTDNGKQLFKNFWK